MTLRTVRARSRKRAALRVLPLSTMSVSAPAGEAQTPVRFPTSDGGVVHSVLRGRRERLEVFAHGGQLTRETWDKQATALTERGYRTLAIDLRGRGESRGGPGHKRDEDRLPPASIDTEVAGG
ncbi:MAG: hypothetical protein OXH49_06130 [Gemmatimonadetes bacterium]|nr:hypothetical protein [Gemmatimonadota bacterium]